MTHPPKAVETLALFICCNNHGHSDLDSLGIIARRMILLRATKICDIIAPFYVDRLRAENAELVAANALLVIDRTALEAQLAAADRLVQSAVRLVDVAVRISEVDNDNRMLAEVAGTQADIAKFRAIRGGGNG